MTGQRRLAAIMFTDVVGYASLLARDEKQACALVERAQAEIGASVERHGGTTLGEMGDSTLSTFPSAVEAVRSALEIQEALKNDPELRLRIALHLGDVVFAGQRVHGEGVNVASRIEPFAPPGGIAASETICEAIRGQAGLGCHYLGRKQLQEVDRPIGVYLLSGEMRSAGTWHQLGEALWARRIPHVLGSYAAAIWATVEVIDWLVGRYGFRESWVEGTLVGLLALLPGVLLVTWRHGAPGRDHWGRPEQIGLPVNGLLAIALAGLVVLQGSRGPSSRLPTVEPHLSLAVLPFRNMSADAENEYFADGLAEELLNILARVDGLRVPSRTSSFAFKTGDADLGTIARELDVSHVVEGSVRKAGREVRVTVQLVDVGSDSQLWSDTYERQLEDIFAVQEEIAAHVLRALGETLGLSMGAVRVEPPTENMAAYELYLQGRELFWRRLDAMPNAIRLLERAVEADPDFSAAWATLGAAYLIVSNYADYPVDEANRRAEQATVRALGLNPDNTEALVVQGWLLYNEFRWADAEASFRRALASNPSDALAHLWYGIFLSAAGYLSEAMTALERAQRLNPAAGVANFWLGAALEASGGGPEAIEYGLRAAELGFPAGLLIPYRAHMREHRYEEARAAMAEYVRRRGLEPLECMPSAVVEAARNPGYTDVAVACFNSHQPFVADGGSFNVYLDAGAIDQGFEMLVRDVETGRPQHLTSIWRAPYRHLRNDPRFLELAEKWGLIDYWGERGAPDLCALVRGELRCR